MISSGATKKIEYAVDKVEKQLAETPWLAGATYTLADINFYSHCGMMVERMFPEMEIAKRAPRLVEWRDRYRGVEEGDRAFLLLIGQHLAEGNARGIVDADMDELPARAFAPPAFEPPCRQQASH